MSAHLHVAVFAPTVSLPGVVVIYQTEHDGFGRVECVLEPANDNFERRDRTWRKS
jgi:hypothetical protein